MNSDFFFRKESNQKPATITAYTHNVESNLSPPCNFNSFESSFLSLRVLFTSETVCFIAVDSSLCFHLSNLLSSHWAEHFRTTTAPG